MLDKDSTTDPYLQPTELLLWRGVLAKGILKDLISRIKTNKVMMAEQFPFLQGRMLYLRYVHFPKTLNCKSPCLEEESKVKVGAPDTSVW